VQIKWKMENDKKNLTRRMWRENGAAIALKPSAHLCQRILIGLRATETIPSSLIAKPARHGVSTALQIKAKPLIKELTSQPCSPVSQ
jgi:hypothetical protein